MPFFEIVKHVDERTLIESGARNVRQAGSFIPNIEITLKKNTHLDKLFSTSYILNPT